MSPIILSASTSPARRYSHTPLRRYLIPALVSAFLVAGAVQAQVGLPTDSSAIATRATAEASAQVGSSISSDGTTPNINAMLDVQSPATGDGKGMLIPRVTENQRTNANASLAGGLLDDSGNLRGGAAQGLIVYQTDDVQGLYFNTSLTAIPVWMYLGGDSNSVSVGREANGSSSGAAMGMSAKGTNSGVALGCEANGSFLGAAVGYKANGYNSSVAVGSEANGYLYSVAIGRQANSGNSGVTLGYQANGYSSGVALGREVQGMNYGVALGREAKGSKYGAAVGYRADGTNFGAAVGYAANGATNGVAVGREANGYNNGVAIGYLSYGISYGVAIGYQANGGSGSALGVQANGYSQGAAVGQSANSYSSGAALGELADGFTCGTALGDQAKGNNYGVAAGYMAKGTNYGTAIGYLANGAQTNVAIGAYANAQGGGSGIQRIAIGDNVTNTVDNSACLRGTLYLDGGTGVMYRANFGSGTVWTVKAFTIDHPLDPANKVLRHFCLEGPQVWNVYAGNAQLVNGQAVVQLPDYYSALNLVGSEIYSLTPIGGAFPVGVGQKVQDNRFVIVAKEDGEVSWTIKVLRNDPACLEDLQRRPVEQLKSEAFAEPSEVTSAQRLGTKEGEIQ